MLARLLPYMEDTSLHSLIDFRYNYSDVTNAPQHAQVTQMKIADVSLPQRAASGAENRRNPNRIFLPAMALIAALGSSTIPTTGKTGNGAFVINVKIGDKAFTDGMSKTLAFSEVKAYQAKIANSGNPAAVGSPVPDTPADVVAYGGTFGATGHTEWVDGKVHETCFTATFPPNTTVPYVRRHCDVRRRFHFEGRKPDDRRRRRRMRPLRHAATTRASCNLR